MTRKITSISFPRDFVEKLDIQAEDMHINRSELVRIMLVDLKFLYEFMGNNMKLNIDWDRLDSESKKKLERIKGMVKWI